MRVLDENLPNEATAKMARQTSKELHTHCSTENWHLLVHWGFILCLRNVPIPFSSFLPFPLQHLTATILVFLASLVVAWLFQRNKWTRQLIGG